MRNKYSHSFTANDGTLFTLTFFIAGGQYIHLIEKVEVYQHAGDLMCQVSGIGTEPVTCFTAQAQLSPYHFAIEIKPIPTGAFVSISETNAVIHLTTQPNLQPCN